MDMKLLLVRHLIGQRCTRPTAHAYFNHLSWIKVCLHLPFFSPFNAAPFNSPFFD